MSKGDQVNRYNDSWCYNPLLQTWEKITPGNEPPSAREGHTTVTIGGKIYHLFGEDNGGVKNDIW